MLIRLDVGDPQACFLDNNRIVQGVICTCRAAFLPEMSPSSKDVPVDQRCVQVRPGAAVGELGGISQEISDDLDLRQGTLREHAVRHPHQELPCPVLLGGVLGSIVPAALPTCLGRPLLC